MFKKKEKNNNIENKTGKRSEIMENTNDIFEILEPI